MNNLNAKSYSKECYCDRHAHCDDLTSCACGCHKPIIALNTIVRPNHYNSHPSGVECITIVQHHNFNIGNAMKYLWRCGLKDGNGEITELQKAKQYIEFEIERLTKNYE